MEPDDDSDDVTLLEFILDIKAKRKLMSNARRVKTADQIKSQ